MWFLTSKTLLFTWKFQKLHSTCQGDLEVGLEMIHLDQEMGSTELRDIPRRGTLLSELILPQPGRTRPEPAHPQGAAPCSDWPRS